MKPIYFAGIAAGAWLLGKRNTGAVGAIVADKCVGVTQCADGTWSTLPYGRPGVCTHHGGVAEGYRKRVVKEKTGEVVDVIEVIDDKGQAVDVIEVPVTGYYRFTTYTTNKGKTRPAIAIRFDRKPQDKVLEVLRNSKFWWNRKEGLWYGWETPDNLEVVESLPIALEGEIAPVVTVEAMEEARAVKTAAQDQEQPAKKTPFKLNPPARGRLYSNDEYGKLKTLLSAQSMRNQRISDQAFPEIRQLWKEIEAFDDWGLKNFPKWARLFSDEFGNYTGKGAYTQHISRRNSDHPAGLLEHYVTIAYDRFKNAYNLSEEKFDAYVNRNYEDVQQFFTDRLTEATAEVRKRIQLLKKPFWFDPDADPQEKIDAGAKAGISSNLMGRIINILHNIDPDEHWVRNEKFNNWRFSKYDLLNGKIRLDDYLATLERRKAEFASNQNKSALRLKKDVGELWQFNREYLKKGYSFHLPTYSRKLREAGIGYLGEKHFYSFGRASESYIEVNMADGKNGIRVMLSIVPGYEVESILIATSVIHECFKGKVTHDQIIFKCYGREKTYPEVKKYLDSEEPIHLLYDLEPVISGLCYNTYPTSIFI